MHKIEIWKVGNNPHEKKNSVQKFPFFLKKKFAERKLLIQTLDIDTGLLYWYRCDINTGEIFRLNISLILWYIETGVIYSYIQTYNVFWIITSYSIISTWLFM